jgi:DNA-binding FadR family transcriptional regulator
MATETTLTEPEHAPRAAPLPRRAHELVAHELLVLILGGGFEAGDRLPAERQLAADFGVSRPTIRQAVATLAARGLLEPRVGSGTFVTGAAVPSDADGSEAASPATLAEVMESRLVFELGAVRLAARRAQRSREDVALLGAVVEALERVEDRTAFPAEIDVAFHRSIVGLAGNALLESLVAPCWHAMAEVVTPAARRVWTAEDTARMTAQHRAVFDALRLGDAELAGFEMERHLRVELSRLAGGTDAERPPSRFFA